MKKIIIGIIIFIIILFVIGMIVYRKNNEEVEPPVEENKTVVETIKIIINDKELIVNLEDNVTSEALIEKLNDGDITINAHDYNNFEKVGDLGFNLPRRDKYIKTESGDVIFYNGNQICIYYDTNTWNFTRIGKIDISQEELKSMLGEGDITYTITK